MSIYISFKTESFFKQATVISKSSWNADRGTMCAVLENNASFVQNENFEIILRPWQLEVGNLLSVQTSRELLWVFDFDGNSGKTEMARYLQRNKNFQKLPIGK